VSWKRGHLPPRGLVVARSAGSRKGDRRRKGRPGVMYTHRRSRLRACGKPGFNELQATASRSQASSTGLSPSSTGVKSVARMTRRFKRASTNMSGEHGRQPFNEVEPESEQDRPSRLTWAGSPPRMRRTYGGSAMRSMAPSVARRRSMPCASSASASCRAASSGGALGVFQMAQPATPELDGGTERGGRAGDWGGRGGPVGRWRLAVGPCPRVGRRRSPAVRGRAGSGVG
jgi:hypothetical protein